jgi:hypothetical protein
MLQVSSSGEHADRQFARLAQLPPPVVAASGMLAVGDIYGAEFLLESVPAFAPHYSAARCDYAVVLLQRHKHAKGLVDHYHLCFALGKGRHYRSYVALMEHWDDALPGKIPNVQHEDVVEDLQGSVRRILESCRLEFESRCVAFHETRRSVRAASSEQVRRPIFKEGLDQWRHWEPWLDPLLAALRPLETRVSSKVPIRSIPTPLDH